MTAADVTKKQPTTQQALGSVLASLSLCIKISLGQAEQRKLSRSRGKQPIKPNWEVPAHCRVRSQSRSQAWGRTGWQSFPYQCLSHLEHLLGRGLRAPPLPGTGSALDLSHMEVFQNKS